MSESKQYFEDRLAEAELYKTHGLDKEACAIYDELLSKIDAEKHAKLYSQIKERLDSARGPAEVHIKEVAPASGANDERRLENCDGLVEAGFFQEAIDELHKLFESSIQPGLISFRIGQCYNRLEKPYEAVDFFEKALSDVGLEDKDRLDILDRLALAQEQNGNMKEAMRALEAVCSLDSTFRDAGKRLEHIKQNAQKSGRFFRLISGGYLVQNDLEQARRTAQQQAKSIEAVLVESYSVDKGELGKSLSEYYGCPFIEYTEGSVGPKPGCVKGISEKFFRTNKCIPLYDENHNLLLAIDNPTDSVRADNVKASLNSRDIELAVALKDDIDKIIDAYYGMQETAAELDGDDDVFEQLELVDETAEEEVVDDSGAVAEGVVVQMVNKIIEDAFLRDASDIHIEAMPGKRGVLIRFRVDGQCLHYKTVPAQFKRPLVARIKIISKLDISERRMPQDGKIKFKTRAGKIIELRVATLPTVGGNEDAVLRLLAASGAMPLEKMGLLDHVYAKFMEVLAIPYGLVLVVGPTGSGKTTTLHAALAKINTPQRKVWTAEDPVEIVQDGLRQVQVQPKINLNFARVLRAFLRADPDVIMVGETRDEETAEIVVESALTGHLVFSTLHTNSAPETVTRLLGMGIDPFNFADSLLAVLAQRLVRRLCVHCKEKYQPDQTERELILTLYGNHKVHPLTDKDLQVDLYRSKGCPKCQHSGYKGRLAVHELLTSNDSLQRKIALAAPVGEIRDLAMDNGMLTLMQDGIWKVIQGHTDLMQIRATCAK
ncbi:MAG: Flp pilus assembly complex ATPase component TadA [Proteobacteria bacterium]|nr:Flp pilus assembly complex ATPase component TadA [Pseudomonadota bacterium]MBU1640774.1 Flp pilus assembly complex ATPase component TadA [Pseudomonadota bacterium]